MSEAVRHFPLTPHQEAALKELRESVKGEVLPFNGANKINSFIHNAQQQNREKLIGQNTLRFVIQHMVQKQTGLAHWFDFNQCMALDQLLISARLLKHA